MNARARLTLNTGGPSPPIYPIEAGLPGLARFLPFLIFLSPAQLSLSHLQCPPPAISLPLHSPKKKKTIYPFQQKQKGEISPLIWAESGSASGSHPFSSSQAHIKWTKVFNISLPHVLKPKPKLSLKEARTRPIWAGPVHEPPYLRLWFQLWSHFINLHFLLVVCFASLIGWYNFIIRKINK